MGKVKQISIKNRTYYFYNDQINQYKEKYKEIGIYYIDYETVKKIANCNNINSENPLYLMINEIFGHFEEKNIQFCMIQMKTKKFQRNMKKFGTELKKILK